MDNLRDIKFIIYYYQIFKIIKKKVAMQKYLKFFLVIYLFKNAANYVFI